MSKKVIWLGFIAVLAGLFFSIFSYQPLKAATVSIRCPTIFRPVCGTDNKTYTNACYALKAGVKIKSVGSCPSTKTNALNNFLNTLRNYVSPIRPITPTPTPPPSTIPTPPQPVTNIGGGAGGGTTQPSTPSTPSGGNIPNPPGTGEIPNPPSGSAMTSTPPSSKIIPPKEEKPTPPQPVTNIGGGGTPGGLGTNVPFYRQCSANSGMACQPINKCEEIMGYAPGTLAPYNPQDPNEVLYLDCKPGEWCCPIQKTPPQGPDATLSIVAGGPYISEKYGFGGNSDKRCGYAIQWNTSFIGKQAGKCNYTITSSDGRLSEKSKVCSWWSPWVWLPWGQNYGKITVNVTGTVTLENGQTKNISTSATLEMNCGGSASPTQTYQCSDYPSHQCVSIEKCQTGTIKGKLADCKSGTTCCLPFEGQCANYSSSGYMCLEIYKCRGAMTSSGTYIVGTNEYIKGGLKDCPDGTVCCLPDYTVTGPILKHCFRCHPWEGCVQEEWDGISCSGFDRRTDKNYKVTTVSNRVCPEIKGGDNIMCSEAGPTCPTVGLQKCDGNKRCTCETNGWLCVDCGALTCKTVGGAAICAESSTSSTLKCSNYSGWGCYLQSKCAAGTNLGQLDCSTGKTCCSPTPVTGGSSGGGSRFIYPNYLPAPFYPFAFTLYPIEWLGASLINLIQR